MKVGTVGSVPALKWLDGVDRACNAVSTGLRVTVTKKLIAR